MDLKELALAEKQSRIPVLSTDRMVRAIEISLSIGKPFDPLQVDTLLRQYDEAKSECEKIEREMREAERQKIEKQIQKIQDELFEMAKEKYVWESSFGDRVALDGKYEWQRPYHKGECPKQGQKVDLSDALNNILNEYAKEISEGKHKKSEIMLYKKLTHDGTLDIRCGAITQSDCPGFRSEPRCNRVTLKLVEK